MERDIVLLRIAGDTRRFLEIGVGSLFLVAGFLKLLDPGQFYTSLQSMDLFPPAWNRLISLVLPALELTIGICFFIRSMKLSAMLWAALLSGMFFLVLTILFFKGYSGPCGCFNDWLGEVGILKLIVSAILTTICIALVWLENAHTGAFIQNERADYCAS